MNTPALQRKAFLLLLVLVTLAFGWILWPFYGAVFWGAVLALLFSPLQRRLLQRMPGRRNLAALATLLICLVIVILPLALITTSLIQEAALVYQRLRSGQWNIGAWAGQVFDALPRWLVALLDRVDLGNFEALQERLASLAGEISQYAAAQAVSIGQNPLQIVVAFGVMMYLLFFQLRDGAALSRRIREALPLDEAHKRNLLAKFAAVIRATVKGNVVVAITQGALGGVILWVLGIQGALLWGTLMAFLSLLPAVGAGLVWGPVAIYFLAVGQIWQGVVLIAFGIFVIGLVDNILRPILVGKDTKMPDWVILISTLGGMAVFGINGFVIGPAIAALFLATWAIFAGTPPHDETS